MTYAQIPDTPLSPLAPPASTGAPLAWPPTGRQIAWKPVGGFFKCPTDFLTLPWGLYRAGRLDFFALRTWLGLLELPERRCGCAPDQDVHYDLNELRLLLDVPRRAPVQAALRTLEELGLVQWSMADIRYLPQPAALRQHVPPAYAALRAQIPAWRSWVPAPRRILRWLAREGTPGLCATAAGVVLRCLWSKQRHCVSGGRVAARWIAQGFGLAERTVQRALDALEALDWLARLPSTDAAAERRWGARTVVNLAWKAPGAPEGDDDEAPEPDRPRQDTARPRRREDTVEHFVKHSTMPDQNLSPLHGDFDQNLSPTPHGKIPEAPVKSSDCAESPDFDLYPLQEQRPDPLPASRARDLPAPVDQNLRTGVWQNTQEENTPPHTPMAETSQAPSCSTPPASPTPVGLANPAAVFATLPQAEQDALVQAATARLQARGLAPAFLIRPAILAEVYNHLVLPVVPSASDKSAALASAVSDPSCEEPSAPAAAPAPVVTGADAAAVFAALSEAEQEALLQAATVRLQARGLATAFLIHPVLLAEVYAHLPVSAVVPAPAQACGAAPARVTPVLFAPSSSCEDPKTPPAPLAPLPDPAVAFAALPQAEQDALLAAATARLLAQGKAKDLLIRPVVLAAAYAELAPPPAAAPRVERREAPAATPPRADALAPPSAASGPPDLRDVVPADLRDVGRLDALRQQAIKRGWITGCEADRLNFIAAAVHARRIGATPCRLFVAIVRDQRWELITDGDEDEARALLRARDADAARPAVAAPRRGLSDDACIVRFVEQTLRNAGSDAEPFAVLAQRDATWTRARWDAARAELRGRSGRAGLERLGEVLGEEE